MIADASIAASKPKYVPVPPPSPKTRPKKAATMVQLIAMQKTLFTATQQETPERLSDLAQLARAWSDLEQLKLRIRMKPAPKPIDTTKLPSKVKKQAASSATNFAES